MVKLKKPSRNLIVIAALFLIILSAFVYSLGNKTSEPGVMGTIGRIIYNKPQVIDCSQKLAQDKPDFLANLLNTDVSVDDCLFTGCSQFFY